MRLLGMLMFFILASLFVADAQTSNHFDTIAEWLPFPAAGPPMKVEFSLVYDVAGKMLIAFGGRGAEFRSVRETWGYDSTTATWINLRPVNNPTWRSSHAMVYDSGRSKVLMFGGDDFRRAYNDLWEYDPVLNTWTELSPANPPDARLMHGMIYDTQHDAVIVFGGRRSGGGQAFNDTWAYHPSTNSWESRHPQQSPPVQDHVNLAYDDLHQKTLLYSGPSNDRDSQIGTWAYDYDQNNWSLLRSSDTPASDHSSLIYHRNLGQVVLFGNTEAGSSMESWTLDYSVGNWTRISSAYTPPYREHFGMAYDHSRDVIILIGGYPANDSWSLRLRR